MSEQTTTTPLVTDEKIMRMALVFADESNEGGLKMTPPMRITAAMLMLRDDFYERRVAALLRERDNLRNFIENIIGKECWNRVEYLDGGDVQDEAERMGVLVQVPHATPCEDELCGCEGEDVDYLYNFAWRVSTQGSNTEPK